MDLARHCLAVMVAMEQHLLSQGRLLLMRGVAVQVFTMAPELLVLCLEQAEQVVVVQVQIAQLLLAHRGQPILVAVVAVGM